MLKKLVLMVAILLLVPFTAEAAERPEMEKYVQEAAENYGLSSSLVEAVIFTESSWRERADNGICKGLMQIQPSTGKWIAGELGIKDLNLFNYKHNIQIGCWYLNYLRDYWYNKGYTDEDTLYLMLVSYNRGPGGCAKWMKNNNLYSNCYANKVLQEKYKIDMEESV